MSDLSLRPIEWVCAEIVEIQVRQPSESLGCAEVRRDWVNSYFLQNLTSRPKGPIIRHITEHRSKVDAPIHQRFGGTAMQLMTMKRRGSRAAEKAIGGVLSVAVGVSFMSIAAHADEIAYTADGYPYVKGEMLIKVRSVSQFEKFLARSGQSMGALGERTPVHSSADGHWFKVKVKEELGAEYSARESAALDEVIFAEPNFIYSTQIGGRPDSGGGPGPDFEKEPSLPNPGEPDPRIGELYGLDLIDAQSAWAISKGSQDIIVGDIDTGIDYNHPDLINNVWRNSAEIPGNNKDDDKNGFVDDVVGWDFRDNDNRPYDDNGHGSHTSGTIGATGGNGVGISGVSQKVSIMALRFLGGASGSGSADDAIECIEYATANGARLTSNSWGGGGFSQALYDAIADANKAGILFIAAAGNARSDNDKRPSYPASYELPNIISVAATDSNDQLASFSNFGAKSVMLAAPGVDILSTVPNKQYKAFSGTSMATPHVAGAAALILAAYPSLTATQLKDLLIQSVEIVSGLEDRVSTGGRLNIAKAFEMAKSRFGSPRGS